MTGVLPDHSAPNVSLQINGVTYYYVMTKDEGEDVTVYVRNEDAVNGGYIFEEVDDWSGLPGNSIQKYFRFPGSNATLWGDGEITVDGTGTVSDASVIYMYRMDIGEEEIICTNPLANPQCPGYIEALYKYLASLENLSADDPYYDEWVQLQLKKETQIEDKQAENKTEDDEEDIEKRLQVDPEVGGLIKLDTQNNFFTLYNQSKIEPYFVVEYKDILELKDNLILEDTILPENNEALRQLASDAKHDLMIRSQYE